MTETNSLFFSYQLHGPYAIHVKGGYIGSAVDVELTPKDAQM